jgi:hypothetical protein
MFAWQYRAMNMSSSCERPAETDLSPGYVPWTALEVCKAGLLIGLYTAVQHQLCWMMVNVDASESRYLLQTSVFKLAV